MNFIQGDIIEAFNRSESMIIAHQCNWTKGMGAGIAKYLALNFPGLSEMDKTHRETLNSCKNVEKTFISGSYAIFDVSESKKIVNIYSQIDVGAPDRVKYDSFENRKTSLKTALLNLTLLDSFKNVSIPLIASGLAKHKDFKYLKDIDYFKNFIMLMIEEIETATKSSFDIYYL